MIRRVLAVLAVAAMSLGAVSSCGPPPVGQMLQDLRLVNYYPKDAGWALMWTKFPIGEMTSDFAAMHAMGANSVRIIMQAYTVGFPNPTATMKSRLAQIVAAADANGLRTQLSLFDWWGEWGNISGSKTWVDAIIGPYKNDPRISFLELRNEIDTTNGAAMSWAKTMMPYLKTAGGNLPVTISIPGNAPASALQTIKNNLDGVIDFYDVHDYGSVTSQLPNDKQIAAPKPLYIGEAGRSSGTGGSDCTSGQQAEADFFTSLNATTTQLGLPLASPWAWQDFTPGSLTWVSSGSGEYCFGLLHVNGTHKSAYDVERAAFG